MRQVLFFMFVSKKCLKLRWTTLDYLPLHTAPAHGWPPGVTNKMASNDVLVKGAAFGLVKRNLAETDSV